MQQGKVLWLYLLEQSENIWGNVFEINNIHILLIPIFLATAIAIKIAGISQIHTPKNHHQLVVYVKANVQTAFQLHRFYNSFVHKDRT